MKRAIKHFRVFTTLMKICLMAFCILSILLFANSYALALGEQEGGFSGNLVIGQEKYKTNGVWVCRPVALDERISSIIKRNNVKSVEDYVEWLQTNIEYRKDRQADKWADPEETLQRRYGDCEDYAFLNEAVLRKVGYQPKVLAMGGIEGTHAICVFVEDGYYSWIDNNKLKRTKAESILEFAKYLFTEYNCCYLLKVSLQAQDWDILFKKSEIVNRTM